MHKSIIIRTRLVLGVALAAACSALVLTGCGNGDVSVADAENSRDVNDLIMDGDQMPPVTGYQEDDGDRTLMDTLKGEWSWVKKGGGFGGNIFDNEFKSVLKILSQNEDASINYQINVADTLFNEGSFQIYNNQFGRYFSIKLPHWAPGDWIINFNDWTVEGGRYRELENVLCFSDGGMDGYRYYYQKNYNTSIKESKI